MAEPLGNALNRVARRKARTRAALVRAAQALIAAGRSNVPILELTQAADVGMGSFYNHFGTREELYAAAVADALDRHGALLDQVGSGLDDPAEVFALSFRLTGRLHRHNPALSKVLLSAGVPQAGADSALTPRARRDIDAAVRAGRFRAPDAELALIVVSGAALCLGRFLHDRPDRDDAAAADQVTEDLLRMFGLAAEEARLISRRSLPEVDLADPGPDRAPWAGRGRLRPPSSESG
ncbi:TetR/AcrR family transcriptional regulator [Kutzneria buriramensis]|uniref:AcrR family transcriptional regulator n=1 Tax=Kutzneria buriramensis TaxID=1045776 RepID=A0A3E0HPV1_9PSEU|nr:TetR/AcrR family transcriptional regulator [Kutzneria buriramensis]REH48444.1 AcrR family transcriptional regulator [Kutzneria buriramensis]